MPRARTESGMTTDPQLPAFTPGLERLRSFYRIAFLPDGYPGRRENDGSITPHPIYGAYVLLDYAKQYEANPSTELREGMSRIAHAAVARMDAIRGGLAFYYDEAAQPIARQRRRHYSGLTQGYYAVALYRAYRATGDTSLRDAADGVFRSLLVPASQGGVLYRWPGGVAIAEVPTRPRDLILNGWLSILHSVGQYADLSGDATAQSLLRRSARTVAALLPLYDVPELANSRYGLTGPVYLRLRFGAPVDGVVLSRVHMSIRHEGSVSIATATAPSRWENYLVDADQEVAVGRGTLQPRRSSVRFNVVLSLLSHPEPNRLAVTVSTPRTMPVSVSAYVGSYDPRTAAPVDRQWVEADATTIPQGRHALELELPWSVVGLVPYPTNFVKQIEGHGTNVYHFIHIKRLRELHRTTGLPELAEWADRWEAYALRWNRMPRYRGLHVRNYFTDIPNASLDLATWGRRARRDRASRPARD